MFKIAKELLIPSYKVDDKLLNLVEQINELLLKFKPTSNNSIYPLEYRTKYSTNSQKNLGLMKAYENMHKFNVFDKQDLFTINGLMLDKQVNGFRKIRVYTRWINNVYKQIEYTDPDLIEKTLTSLNDWYTNCKDNILIKSCAYIFGFVNIHPFEDGNGRTSRYVLTWLLSKYDEKLRYFPYEELLNDRYIKKFQVKLSQDLYKTDPSKTGDNCYRLIYFYLSLLRNKLKEVVTGIKPTTVFN